MFGGFRERAERTYRILQDRETAFIVVAAPEPDAVREAAYFAGRLDTERMPLAGLVLNRVTTVEALSISADAARAAAHRLDELGDHEVTADAMRVHAALLAQSARQAAVAARFVTAYPQVPMVRVPVQAADVHDLDGLRAIGRALGRPSPPAEG